MNKIKNWWKKISRTPMKEKLFIKGYEQALTNHLAGDSELYKLRLGYAPEEAFLEGYDYYENSKMKDRVSDTLENVRHNARHAIIARVEHAIHS